MVFCNCRDFLQQLDCLFTSLLTDPIMGPLTIFPAAYNAGVTEDLHVIREGGLGHPHLLRQDAGALLAGVQQLQNPLPPFITEGLEYPCPFFIHRCHALTSNQVFLIYYKTQIENCQSILFFLSSVPMTLLRKRVKNLPDY